MANWFYYDASGQKQGPVNDAQLAALVLYGTIVPTTQMETESGQKGLAGQIPSLQFPVRAPRPTSQQSSEQGGISSWLLDFGFQDLRLPVINLWACKVLYAICWIVVVGALLFGTLGLLGVAIAAAREPEVSLACFAGIFGLWIVAVATIFAARLLCEWYIILFDWIVVTTQAARLSVDRHKTRRE